MSNACCPLSPTYSSRRCLARAGSNTWVIFSEELRGHLRSRWYLFFTAAVVVLLVIAMLVVPLFQGEEDTSGATTAPGEDLRQIGFLDQSGLFPALGQQSGPVRYPSEGAGLEAVARGEIDSFYVITEDYLQSGTVEEYAEFEGRFPPILAKNLSFGPARRRSDHGAGGPRCDARVSRSRPVRKLSCGRRRNRPRSSPRWLLR